MDTNLHIRLSKDLKESFQHAAKENNTDTSSLVREWIISYVSEHERANEATAMDLYLAGYELQQAFGGRDQVNKELAKQLQEHSLTNQKEFTQLILSTYLDLDLTIPAIVSKTSQGYAFSQMFLLGLLGDKPKDARNIN